MATEVSFNVFKKGLLFSSIKKLGFIYKVRGEHYPAMLTVSTEDCTSGEKDVAFCFSATHTVKEKIDENSIVLLVWLDQGFIEASIDKNPSIKKGDSILFKGKVFHMDDIDELAKSVVIDASSFIRKSSRDEAVPVSLQPASKRPSYESVLWEVVKERTGAISFDAYGQYLNGVFCLDSKESSTHQKYNDLTGISFQGSNAYDALDMATDYFLKEECGVIEDNNMLESWLKFVDKDDPGTNLLDKWRQNAQKLKDDYLLGIKHDVSQPLPLPYMQLIREKLGELPLKSGMALGFSINAKEREGESCYGISTARAACPTMIELIWSYWMEESLLVQTMNAITRRFQNVRAGHVDPLARMDIDPLRPMSNLLWGYIQDEPSRLSLIRRAYEYDHHYGFSLAGKAVPKIKTADSRSRFLGAFHQLLNLAHRFFRAYDDTTIKADAFPLLNALREVHLILAEGAHNQYGDLPWVARKEMLMMQWLLARPEMREFIGGRTMVPQKERWMDRVDGMKRLQGWSGTATTHFVDLAQTGERLLLSIRFASWSQIDKSEVALSWAVFWRDDIQRYAHAYRAVTGVDLTEPLAQTALDTKPPSYWLLQHEAS